MPGACAGPRQPDMSTSAYGLIRKSPVAEDELLSVDPGPVTSVMIDGAVICVTVYLPRKIADRLRVTGREDRFTRMTSFPA